MTDLKEKTKHEKQSNVAKLETLSLDWAAHVETCLEMRVGRTAALIAEFIIGRATKDDWEKDYVISGFQCSSDSSGIEQNLYQSLDYKRTSDTHLWKVFMAMLNDTLQAKFKMQISRQMPGKYSSQMYQIRFLPAKWLAAAASVKYETE